MLIKLNLNKMALFIGENLNEKKNVGCVLNVALKNIGVMDCKNLRLSHIFENVKLAA